MALYHITEHGSGPREVVAVRKQWPAACDAYYAAVYNRIKSVAGLDTQWGNTAASLAMAHIGRVAGWRPEIGEELKVRIGGYPIYITLRREG